MGLLDRFKSEEWHEKKRQEQLRNFKRSQDIRAGRFCKGCGRTGEFDNQCNDCLQHPFCNNCVVSNKRYGTICYKCAPKYLCKAQGCMHLSDDDCVVCGRQICQNHWEALFVTEKGQYYDCVYDKGRVCRYCVVKTGTFTKHFKCAKCGNELQQLTIS